MRPDRLTRALAATALAGAALAVVLIGGLTLFAPEVDPIRRTISEYGLRPEYKPIFDVGVLAFAAALVLALSALVGAGITRWRSMPSAGLLVAAAGLVAVVVFEKTDWSVGPSVGGYIHRYASLVTFLALPLATVAVAHRFRGDARFARSAAWSRRLAVLSLAWFVPILAGFALRPLTGRSWWQTIPLGLVERGLALSEVLVVGALAVWGLVAAREPVRAPAGAFPHAA